MKNVNDLGDGMDVEDNLSSHDDQAGTAIKFASFDLEIAKDLPEQMDRWEDHAPLGITCAALALSDREDVTYWSGVPKLDQSQCVKMVHDLQSIVTEGYKLLTWNGAGFDFKVLAQESGMYRECGELALNHIDMMLLVTFKKGWYLSLQKVLDGAGLKGKLKKVVLSDGTILHDMDGAKAPKLWASGEHDAVFSYLKGDVVQPLELVEFILKEKKVVWTSNSGRPMTVPIEKLQIVRECFSIPEPDVTWMDDPPSRSQFISWVPKDLLEKMLPTQSHTSDQSLLGETRKD